MRYDKQKGWFYNQHSCFLLQYHLIFVTKYRHPVLTGEVKEFVYSYLKEKMEAYGLNVMAMNGEFLLQYHLIFVTKYRHPVLTGEVKEFVYSYLKEKMEAYGLNVMAMNGEPDHVHILFEAPPNRTGPCPYPV